MWMMGSRVLWLSSLWVWGKSGWIVWSGPAFVAPPVAKVQLVQTTHMNQKTARWWKQKGSGNIAARDVRSFKPKLTTSPKHTLSKHVHAHKHAHHTPHRILKKVLPKTRIRSRKKGPLRLSSPIPHARVGSGYGWRMSPISGKMRFHRGLDYGASYGTPIRAAAGGIIWRTGWMGSCGLGIVMVHRSGVTTCYCHLSQILASYRSRVRRGQIIGRVGSTGSSTAPHLHFSVLHRRKFVDPKRFLQK